MYFCDIRKILQFSFINPCPVWNMWLHCHSHLPQCVSWSQNLPQDLTLCQNKAIEQSQDNRPKIIGPWYKLLDQSVSDPLRGTCLKDRCHLLCLNLKLVCFGFCLQWCFWLRWGAIQSVFLLLTHLKSATVCLKALQKRHDECAKMKVTLVVTFLQHPIMRLTHKSEK